MATATIPVDLRNPGQVFACLGFMEAAEVLCGSTRGGFDWSGAEAYFTLEVEGQPNIIEVILNFAIEAEAREAVPENWGKIIRASSYDEPSDGVQRELGNLFPSARPESMALPVLMSDMRDNRILLSHWADGSSRDRFKLYAGNRSALKIVNDMRRLMGNILLSIGREIFANPLGITFPMGGSFNLDPQGTWSAIDAGYSPDRLNHLVTSSPVTQLFAAIGLENARPIRLSTFEYLYRVWKGPLPTVLARAALAYPLPSIACRRFRLPLFRPNPNSRAVRYAQEEFTP